KISWRLTGWRFSGSGGGGDGGCRGEKRAARETLLAVVGRNCASRGSRRQSSRANLGRNSFACFVFSPASTSETCSLIPYKWRGTAFSRSNGWSTEGQSFSYIP